MYDYLKDLSFEECVKVLKEKNIQFDFGEDETLESILDFIEKCKIQPEEYSFEGDWIYIGGYWGDHTCVYFNDDFKVTSIDFEEWD